MEENINESIKNYLNTLKESYKRKESPEWAKQPIEKGSGIYYDNNEIIDNHPLNKHIADGAYKTYASVVFDTKTYNFHIFPSNIGECEILVKEFLSLIEEFKKRSEQLKTELNIKKIKFGNGTISALNKIDSSMPNGIFKYIEIVYNNQYYSINFMRYTCKDNVVGCTMRAIQFHKNETKYINGLGICYPETDDDNTYKKIISSTVEKQKHKEKIIEAYENICYNPPVVWPTDDKGEWEQDKIEDIVNCFIAFIVSGTELKDYNPKDKKNDELWKKYKNKQDQPRPH